jgi:3-oxoadipate enol-lactonase
MPRLLANNVGLHYVEAGRGEPPLLLLHGLGGSLDIWRPILGTLAAARRVLAGDHRGHGASDKPGGPYTVRLLADDWVAALDALGIARADLLGLSLGGAVAMTIAARDPARVRALVLEDTWAYPHPDFVGMLRARLELLARGDMAGYAEAAIPQVYSDAYARANPAALDAYRARVAATEPGPLASAVRACLAHDMRGELARITAPTLVIVGAEDRLTPPFHAQYLFHAIAGAKLAVIEGSAHFPHLEAPAQFLGCLGRFVTGLA